MPPSGKLILCATPIGNLEDVSRRALETIGAADILACEDTRRTRKLLTRYGLHPRRVIVYNDANERRRAPELVQEIQRGATVVLVSDSGMPGLSDPGYRLVGACIAAGANVGVIPGPTAVISALAVSGLPTGRFVFEGFLPRKQGERQKRIAELASDTRTLVIYESPHRVAACLADLRDVLGDRPAAVVRELTKVHEEVRRAGLSELAEAAAALPPRGEIVLVVGGAVHEHKDESDASELARKARSLMESGVERSAALTQVARASGAPRRKVFDALVEHPE